MKRKWVGFVGLAMLVVVIVTAFAGCGGNSLSGTWVLQGEDQLEIPTTIAFNGNRFTVTKIGATYSTRFPNEEFRVQEEFKYRWMGRNWDSIEFVREEIHEALLETGEEIEEVVGGDNPFGLQMVTRERITKPGEELIRVYRVLTIGTYSTTDDRIEFVFSDEHIEVMNFTRTENTLSIEGIGTFHRS